MILLENPVFQKELTYEDRGKKWYRSSSILSIIGYLSILIGPPALVFFVCKADDTTFGQEAAWGSFVFTSFLQIMYFAYIAYSQTATMVVKEKDRGTLDALQSTLLSPREILLGKLGAPMAFLSTLLASSFVLMLLYVVAGWVSFLHLAMVHAFLFLTAATFASLGVHHSTRCKSQAEAINKSAPVVAFLFLGTFLMDGILNGILQAALKSYSPFIPCFVFLNPFYAMFNMTQIGSWMPLPMGANAYSHSMGQPEIAPFLYVAISGALFILVALWAFKSAEKRLTRIAGQ
ncbi:MAG: ABC transporter permease subunit [Armatimonadetes bacterium]|nr:ABC transporter permease subunit [Armatimonadota bacterium]